MGANGSFDKTLGGVPEDKRTHLETGHTVLGHKVLLQDGTENQTRNIMNSNSSDPIYLMAKKDDNGYLKILNINDFSNHLIGYEVNLKFNPDNSIKPYNGQEGNSHGHEWIQGSDGIMQRKPTTGNSHLPIPTKYDHLIQEIIRFNKQRHVSKK